MFLSLRCRAAVFPPCTPSTVTPSVAGEPEAGVASSSPLTDSASEGGTSTAAADDVASLPDVPPAKVKNYGWGSIAHLELIGALVSIVFI